MIYLISLIFLAIIAIEVPALIRGKMWRELSVFTVLLMLAMVYGYGFALNITLPTPTDAVNSVFKPISKYVDKLLS